ncbi:AGAP010979-PA-like protein [Anopheles sinensis]|uniref:AGAP010979-PA-like protein n=1 Tax=Anopheles sinensis TaxID=74873 RepID=A0A084VCA9_ANOSI|nr:AGAP010979-PA-like protein [Anopheles sinensis]
MDRNIISAVNISSFCRICTTNNDVEWSIYETLNEDEGATNLHTMLVKLYPTVFNESQMLCDEALKWPMKICKECKTKVIESYRFYERCTKSARSLRTIALKEQSTTETSQEEKDDHPAVIKTEFIEFEEATVLKEEYDSDDYSSACNGFHEGSSKDDVFSDTEDSLPAPTSSRNSSASVDKRQQKQCNKNKAKSRGKMCL